MEKTCVTCIHLLGKRTNVEDADTKWRCVHPNNVLPSHTNLVTGVVTRCYKEESLSVLREYEFDGNKCGVDGKHWELYTPPAPPVFPETEKQTATATSKTPVLDKLKKLKINPDDL